ncbi:MAG: hypothetical protein AAGG44_12455 [Planctomycetota bacterium]
MPIEFACESCARLLRVPDGSEGSQCECPACSTILEIPDPAAIGMIEVHHQADDLKLDMQIPCPRCRQILRCAPKLLGTKGQCRHCKYIFTITDEPEEPSEEGVADSNWVFSCPKCDQLFEGTEEMRGRKGKCHVCGEVFAIELRMDSTPTSESAGLEASVPQATERGAETPSNTEAAASEEQQEAMVQFSCATCDGIMEVPAAAAGQTTVCPYCSTHLIIPEVRASSDSNSANASQASESGHEQVNTTSPDEFRLQPLDVEGGHYEQQSQRATDPYADIATETAATNTPYSPPPDLPSVPAGNWQAPSSRTRKKLTFSNVFSAAFENAFPNCLISSLAYMMTSILAAAMFYGGVFAAGLVMGLLQVDPVVMITVLGIVGVVMGIIAMGVVGAGYCIMANGALLSVRGQAEGTNGLFDTGGSMGTMLLFWVIVGLPVFLLYGLLALLSFALGPENSIVVVSVLSLVGLLYLLFGLAVSLAPFAILDGQGVIQAMQTSMWIFSRKGPLLVGVALCGGLLITGVSSVTCGIGSLLLSAFPIYLLAAFYHLAPKPQGI